MSGDVLRGNPAGSTGKSVLVAQGLISRKVSLWMTINVGPVAAQGEHEKELGVHSRGRHPPSVKRPYRGLQGLSQAHEEDLNTTKNGI